MDSNWNIVYYENLDGEAEVFDFINSQKAGNKAKILSWLSMLEEKGSVLPRPYADLLKDGIHELRIKLSGNQVRVLYFFVTRILLF
ncbi:MAG: type II toxin-antitoxin system RelE/ParE family toxin [Spirochaetales bacterium]|nr:type II toxin-antitoxin system RelE/ParE family toxin [Spirochaetales bacterium]